MSILSDEDGAFGAASAELGGVLVGAGLDAPEPMTPPLTSLVGADVCVRLCDRACSFRVCVCVGERSGCVLQLVARPVSRSGVAAVDERWRRGVFGRQALALNATRGRHALLNDTTSHRLDAHSESTSSHIDDHDLSATHSFRRHIALEFVAPSPGAGHTSFARASSTGSNLAQALETPQRDFPRPRGAIGAVDVVVARHARARSHARTGRSSLPRSSQPSDVRARAGARRQGIGEGDRQ